MSDWQPNPNPAAPPLEPGNRVAQKHGAYSPRTWKPLAATLAADLVEVAPWCGRDTFAASVAAWSMVEAQIRLILDYLDEVGPLTKSGRPQPALDMLDRLQRSAKELRSELGLGPASLAKLLKDISSVAATVVEDTGLEALVAQGRAIRQRAEQRHASAALAAAEPLNDPDGTEGPGADDAG